MGLWILDGERQTATIMKCTQTTDDAVCPLWSMTKTIIAALALRLEEQGLVSLDAPVLHRPYTLAQLLRHTAGVPNYGRLPSYHQAVSVGAPAWSAETLLAWVQADKLDFAPGTKWAYSNTGYLIARQIMEDASGLSLSRLIQSHLAEPLELTSLRLLESVEETRHCAYLAESGYDPRWVYHGLAVSNRDDAVRLFHAVFASELLTKTSRERMLQRIDLPLTPPTRPWSSCGYGLGIMYGTIPNLGAAIGHSGVGPQSASACYHFPDLSTPQTACAFCAGSDESPAEWDVARQVTDRLVEHAPSIE